MNINFFIIIVLMIFFYIIANYYYLNLSKKIDFAQKKGVCDIIIDPGFGFGKTLYFFFHSFIYQIT